MLIWDYIFESIIFFFSKNIFIWKYIYIEKENKIFIFDERDWRKKWNETTQRFKRKMIQLFLCFLFLLLWLCTHFRTQKTFVFSVVSNPHNIEIGNDWQLTFPLKKKIIYNFHHRQKQIHKKMVTFFFFFWAIISKCCEHTKI